ncbi:MAG: hypothetical protein U1F43_26955 [Myxococcota bacterium]
MKPGLLLSACALLLTGTASARAEAPVEFDAELKALWRVAACEGTDLDPRFDKAVVDAHCKDLEKILDAYRNDWLAKARPFFDQLVPKDVPKTVVYPFAGGDLMTALAVYPDLNELTTVSLESGGDPRGIDHVDKKQLEKALAGNRRFINELVVWNHNRTIDLGNMELSPLPSQLIFALIGLHVLGYEPVGLHAITLEADGSVRGLGATDIAGFDKEAAKLSGSSKNKRLNTLFSNYELRFRKKGSTEVHTYRHFMVNLSDKELAADPRLMKHLEAKGRISAMTKAASHLLWHGAFSTIREYLKAHMVWMVSDSTGINPMHLDPAKFEQTTYGSFDVAIFNPTAAGQKALKALFDSEPKRALPMKFFGYPTKLVKGFLMVTVPKG